MKEDWSVKFPNWKFSYSWLQDNFLTLYTHQSGLTWTTWHELIHAGKLQLNSSFHNEVLFFYNGDSSSRIAYPASLLLFWSGGRSHVPHANPFPVTAMDSRPHDSMNNFKSLRWYSHSIYKCCRCNIENNKVMPWSTIVSNQGHLSQKKSACLRNTSLRGWKCRCSRITMSSQGEITTHVLEINNNNNKLFMRAFISLSV